MSNESIFNESKKYIPGGLNSPVRDYRSMEINPVVIKSGQGVIITDEDGRNFIDFVLAGGSLILGHCNDNVVKSIKEAAENGVAFGASTKLELEMAQLLCETMPNVDMVRVVNSGEEALMSAIKLARDYTKRDKIVRFSDDSVSNTLMGIYNDENQVRELFKNYGKEIAAVIIEPVTDNIGVVKAKEKFVKKIKMYCDRFGALLIFNEVMSGFRVSFTGAQSIFDVKPDLVTYGNIIGGGLQCGAYGGRKEIMEKLSPLGMSASPIAMASGLATLRQVYDHPEYYNHIENVGKKLEDGITKIKDKYNFPATINRAGGMFTIFFKDGEVTSYDDVKKCDEERFKRYFAHMINSGFNIASSQYEALFLSTAHNITHVFKFLKAFEEFVKKEVE